MQFVPESHSYEEALCPPPRLSPGWNAALVTAPPTLQSRVAP